MNGKTVSAALNGLPEDMIAEAMEPGRKSRGIPWLRLAACIALVFGLLISMNPAQPEIVTAPGILTVTVYAIDENSETGYRRVLLEEGVDTGYLNSWPLGLSIVPGIPVQLSVDSSAFASEDITFRVSVNSGMYLGDSDEGILELPAQFTCKNHSTYYWNPFHDLIYDSDWTFDDPKYDCIYTDIVIYCQEHIVGYAVLRFDRQYDADDDPKTIYDTRLLASVLFPKKDDDYQNIPLEYVEECIRREKIAN